MGSMERSKKRVQLWKKAIVHFILCFVMGFFTGFAPTRKPSIFNNVLLSPNQPNISVMPDVKNLHHHHHHHHHQSESVFNRSLMAETPVNGPTRSKDIPEREKVVVVEEEAEDKFLSPKKLVIVITPTTSTKHRSRAQVVVFLRRLADTLRLVPPPLLWIVVEGKSEESSSSSSEISEMLRKTGIMYRHLVFDEEDESFTYFEAEMDHQRNLALTHIEHHRLSGIVHFAGLSNVYDLGFFEEIRNIEVFGTWAMASLSANRKKVIIEGPVCESSQVIGWHLRKKKNQTDSISPFHISTFAFNSSILWDPERWGRPSSIQDNSQNSIKFVKQMVLEDETKLKGIPQDQDCSKVMLWHLHYFPTINTKKLK